MNGRFTAHLIIRTRQRVGVRATEPNCRAMSTMSTTGSDNVDEHRQMCVEAAGSSLDPSAQQSRRTSVWMQSLRQQRTCSTVDPLEQGRRIKQRLTPLTLKQHVCHPRLFTHHVTHADHTMQSDLAVEHRVSSVHVLVRQRLATHCGSMSTANQSSNLGARHAAQHGLQRGRHLCNDITGSTNTDHHNTYAPAWAVPSP